MPELRLTVGGIALEAEVHESAAPRTCAALRRLWPLRTRLVQARWSGEAAWVPLGDLRIGVEYENHTSHPAPGELLLYPGGVSEMEILFPYGATRFASKVGQLAGNHFATVRADRAILAEIGRRVMWDGAQELVIEDVEAPAR
jgi:Protein of unknown function (DUF3830)